MKLKWDKKAFDLGTASMTILIAFCSQIIFQLIVKLMGLSAFARNWVAVVGNQVVLFGVCMIFCVKNRVNPAEITGVKRPPKWYFFPLFVLIAISCLIAFLPFCARFSYLLKDFGYGDEPNYFIPYHSSSGFTLAFLALTILPAIGEETALRGVLLSGGKERSPLFAIFFTAIIFALLHCSLHQLIHQFLLGAVMGYLAYLTGGIYASATVHLVNNGLAMLLEHGAEHGWLNKNVYFYFNGALDVGITVAWTCVGFFALAMLLVLVTCLMHRERSKTKEYIPVLGPLSQRIRAYMVYLSGEELVEKEETEESRSTARYSLILAIVLFAVLATIVLLTLIPEVRE